MNSQLAMKPATKKLIVEWIRFPSTTEDPAITTSIQNHAPHFPSTGDDDDDDDYGDRDHPEISYTLRVTPGNLDATATDSGLGLVTTTTTTTTTTTSAWTLPTKDPLLTDTTFSWTTTTTTNEILSTAPGNYTTAQETGPADGVDGGGGGGGGGGGLSTTTKVAIAVPVAVVGAAILAIILFFLIRRRRRRRPELEISPPSQMDMAPLSQPPLPIHLSQQQLQDLGTGAGAGFGTDVTTPSSPSHGLILPPPPPTIVVPAPAATVPAAIARRPVPQSPSDTRPVSGLEAAGVGVAAAVAGAVAGAGAGATKRDSEALEWRTSEERRPRSPFDDPDDDDDDDDAMSDVSGMSDRHHGVHTRAIDDDLSSVSSFEDDDRPPAARSGNL